MADIQTTELLPCPFCGGEAEIERYTIKPYVACMKCGCSMPDRHQTAEQAIEAWNTRATHGTLTAEQVMGIAGKHQPDYCSDTHVCFDWQAIADELNAALGRGTCRISASSTDGLCSDNPRQRFELSCGHSFTLDGLGAPVACPVCGKAVKQ